MFQLYTRRIARHLPLRKTYSSLSPNAELIEKIRQVVKEEQRQEVPYTRIRALVLGLEFISKLDYKLTHIELAQKLPVGQSFLKVMADHLPSIASEAPAISEKERKELGRELKSIEGLSHHRASQLILAGCRSKSDLLRPEYLNMLPEVVQYHVRFASHLEKPVTRQQTETAVDFIREILPKNEVIPVGSYRRNAPTETYVSILILRDVQYVPHPPPPLVGYLQPPHLETFQPPGSIREAHLHNTIIPLLKGTGMAFAPRTLRYWSWRGILRVPKRRLGGEGWETMQERVDGVATGKGEFVFGRIHMLPSKSRGAAMLYYTGTPNFLRLIDHKARALGLYFHYTGLWKWHPAPSEEIVGTSVSLEAGLGEEEDEGGKLTQGRQGKKGEEEGGRLKKREGRGKKEEEEEDDSIQNKGKKEGKRAEGFWQMLPSADEEVIFEQLGMEYISPERRSMEL